MGEAESVEFRMGYRSSWIAVRGVELGTLVDRLGLGDTGRRADFAETGLYGVASKGWSVVLASGGGFLDRLTDGDARRVSDLGAALFLWQDDTPMTARLHAFESGAEAWSVTYDGSGGVSEPVVAGTPPKPLAKIVARCAREQQDEGGPDAGVDCMYDVVAELGLALVGFRHDRIPAGDQPYQVLTS